MSGPDEIASSLEALTERYRAIAHNLANANTAGFKRISSDFHRLLAAGLPDSGARVEARSAVDYTQGPLVQTGRAMDLAIRGKGFFVLESPEGVRYTRSGTFLTNSAGQLVDGAGRLVAGENGPIIVPQRVSPSAVKVAPDGEVLAEGRSVGRLKIVDFPDRSALLPAGGSTFRAAPDATPAPPQNVEIHQGFVESSNVNVMDELVNLILVTRLYEANFKSLGVQDERMRNLLQVAMA